MGGLFRPFLCVHRLFCLPGHDLVGSVQWISSGVYVRNLNKCLGCFAPLSKCHFQSCKVDEPWGEKAKDTSRKQNDNEDTNRDVGRNAPPLTFRDKQL